MYRVLIADDEPIERQVVGKKIGKYFGQELQIIEAVNGREAVALFEKNHCQIAILDIEMPGMSGLEAAEHIREKDKSCSIIFLTAFDEFKYAKRAILVRALDYLLKPGTDEELIAVLEEAIHIADTQEADSQSDKSKKKTEARKDNAEGKRHGKSRHAADPSNGDHEQDVQIKNQNADIFGMSPQERREMEELPENIRIKAVAKTMKTFIENHYKEDISLQDVAGEMNYSDAYFCKLFKQCFDKSFIVYLSEFRVEKAKELLADIVVSVKDVSMEVGYRDSNYFAKVFKRMTGLTPSEYRYEMQRRDESL